MSSWAHHFRRRPLVSPGAMADTGSSAVDLSAAALTEGEGKRTFVALFRRNNRLTVRS